MAKFVRFTLSVAVLMVAGVLVGCNSKEEPISKEETAKLIQPVARVEMEDNASAATTGADAKAGKVAAADGKKVYEGACVACHAGGVAGAPKFGDKGMWAPRIATGLPALYHSALNGKGLMPAKAGNPALSDAEVKAGVDYMVAQAK